MRHILSLLCFLLFLCNGQIHAQSGPPIRNGSLIRITENHYQTDGVLLGWSADSLTFRPTGAAEVRTVALNRAQRIEVGRVRSRGERTLRGSLLGALLGGAVGAGAAAADDGNEFGSAIGLGVGFGVAVGAAVGATSGGRPASGDLKRSAILGGILGMASFVTVVLADDDGDTSDLGFAVFLGGGPGALLGLGLGALMPSEPARWDPLPVSERCGESYWRLRDCASDSE
jgi:hypothetical protein